MAERGPVSGPLERFAAQLRECRQRAGDPSTRTLERLTERAGHRYARATIADKLTGRSTPDWPFVRVFVGACALHAGAGQDQLTRIDLSGWRQAHQQLLQDIATARQGQRRASQAAAALAGPACTLPPDTLAFTGRSKDTITTVVSGAAAGGVVAIHAIDGMPGIGKTALAVHAAHRMAERFPDGQLFLDLHAHTAGQDPTPPEVALASVLTLDGVDARYLPRTLEERGALWRARMAGKRVLLVLDNAAGSAQVTPLLPGAAGCLVLVTSRRHLGDLPAAAAVISVRLDVLPPAQARAMFLTLAARAARDTTAADATTVDSTAGDELVDQLVELCGRLPLAISLLARVHAKHPSWTLADLITMTTRTLLTVKAENATVAAAFDLSYDHLPTARQHFFRYLGLHVGVEIDAYAAAALTGTTLEAAAGHLDGLYGDHLLTEPAPNRYGMHDLIRRYAVDHGATEPADDRARALERLLDYYQHTATLADTHLARQTRPAPAPCVPPAAPDLPVHARALAWARAERGNLLACLDHATRTGQPARVVALTAALAAVLQQDGPWADAITRHAAAVQAARHLGDRLGEAYALHDLGNVRWLTADRPGAVEALQAALGIFRGLGERTGAANTLDALGAARQLTGDYRGAAQAHEEALAIHRDLGDRRGEANALNGLGAVRRLTNDYPQAAEALEAALGICRGLGNRTGEADALIQLGAVWRATGDYPAAAGAHEEALGIYRGFGDRLGEANALRRLGTVRWSTRDYPQATEALLAALDIARDLGDRWGEGSALSDLGVVQRSTGDYAAAARSLEAAFGLARDTGERAGEAETLNEVGTLHRLRGNVDQARICHRQALALARQIHTAQHEAHALAGLARCAQATGHTLDA